MKQPEVLVVGSGPTGLSLAITLRRFGVPTRVVDRATAPSGVSKALAVWSGSLEALDGMGVITDFVAAGQRLNALKVGDAGHELASLAVGEGIDSPYPFPLLLPQSRTEQLLAARLAALGTLIDRGVELVGLAQDGAGVNATLRRAMVAAKRCARVIWSAATVRAASYAKRSELRSTAILSLRSFCLAMC